MKNWLCSLAFLLCSLSAGAQVAIECTSFPCPLSISSAQCPSGLPCAVTITTVPLPPVAISPSSLSFAAPLDTDSNLQVVLASNASGSTLPLTWSFAGAGFGDGGVSTCRGDQITTGKCGISVKFHPTVAGAAQGTLTINAGVPNLKTVINLTGSTPPASTSLTMGETNVLPTHDSGNGNLLVAQQAMLSRAATMQSLSFYVTAAGGTLRLGVYDASGPSGGPGAQVAAAPEITPVTGWNTVPVVSPALLPAGSYWLAYLSSSNALGFLNTTTAGVGGVYSRFSYAALPASFSTAPGTTTSHWSFYATLSAGPQTSKSVQLSWFAPLSGGAASYNLYRKLPSGSYALVGNVVSSILTFTDTAVPSGTYLYMARSLDSAGRESVNSNEVSVVIP